MTAQPGYCSEGDRCVCGGDLQSVREGCGSWVKLGGPVFDAVTAEVAARVRSGSEPLDPAARTLRDEFAIAALPALVREDLKNDEFPWDMTAETAYRIADAMLAERERGG